MHRDAWLPRPAFSLTGLSLFFTLGKLDPHLHAPEGSEVQLQLEEEGAGGRKEDIVSASLCVLGKGGAGDLGGRCWDCIMLGQLGHRNVGSGYLSVAQG